MLVIAIARQLAACSAGRPGEPAAAARAPRHARPGRTFFAADLSDAEFPAGVWTVADGVTSPPRRTSASGRPGTTRTSSSTSSSGRRPGTNSGVIVYARWTSPTGSRTRSRSRSPTTSPSSGPRRRPPGTARAIFGHLAPTKSAVKTPGRVEPLRRSPAPASGSRSSSTARRVTDMDMSLWTSAKTNPDGSEIPAWLSRPAAELATKGRIGFQGKHAGALIYFRNIRIRPVSRDRGRSAEREDSFFAAKKAI
ncbi:MAG: DUF1080 domain-containing protein [Marinilabiliales bacterium]|nr:DUF1080 domain-containing protein [Marinilabiliales bacterium]